MSEFIPEHRHIAIRTNPANLCIGGVVEVWLDDKTSETEFKQHDVYARLKEKYSIVIIHPEKLRII